MFGYRIAGLSWCDLSCKAVLCHAMLCLGTFLQSREEGATHFHQHGIQPEEEHDKTLCFQVHMEFSSSDI